MARQRRLTSGLICGGNWPPKASLTLTPSPPFTSNTASMICPSTPDFFPSFALSDFFPSCYCGTARYAAVRVCEGNHVVLFMVEDG